MFLTPKKSCSVDLGSPWYVNVKQVHHPSNINMEICQDAVVMVK